MSNQDQSRRNLRLGLTLFALFIVLFILAAIIVLVKN